MKLVIVDKRKGEYLKTLLISGSEYRPDWGALSDAHIFNSTQEAVTLCKHLSGVDILDYSYALSLEDGAV